MTGAGVLVVTGPTATGKTQLGIRLALELGGEVVSADSMQVYRGMDIGTAKPSSGEMCAVRHHMLDVAEPWEDYSVSRYADEAAKCVDDILLRGRLPIIVGGTGLYIDALLRGTDFAPKADEALRDRLSGEYDALGEAEFRARLCAVDPISAGKISPNDKKRLVRAMEVYLLAGEPLSAFDARSRAAEPRYRSARVALCFEDRQALYSRIDRRVDMMMEQGLYGEVEGLLASGLPDDCTAMQAIGYKELAGAIRGECTVSAAVGAIKQSSRRYAKRQLSWLRRDGGLRTILWENEPDMDRAAAISTKFAHENGIL